MFGWWRPRCPVDPVARDWIDRRWQWLIDEFGAELMLDSPNVLPTPEFFPDEYDGSERAVRRMVSRVCGYMRVPDASVDVEVFSEGRRPDLVDEFGHALGGTAGMYESDGDRVVIHLERLEFDDPMELVGTIAHELAHARLLGEGRVFSTEFDHELLTDLTVVFHGLGIFMANSPRHLQSDADLWPGTDVYKPQYMTAAMFGYALARRCWLREEPLPAWRKQLAPGVRAEFKQALRFLQQLDR